MGYPAPMAPSKHATESGENVSEIERLTARAHDMGASIGTWNNVYMILVALTAILAAGVFIAQFVISKKGSLLSQTQDAIIKEKDRIAKADSDIKDGRIAEALLEAGVSNKAAGEANERAGKAQASLALAEQHAAEANTKAEGFRLDIAKANEESAQAQAQVAGAMAESAKANLELAKFKTPRTLSPEQQKRISSRIEVFPNTPYDLWVNTDSDSTVLMSQIDDALHAGKWQFKLAGIIRFGNRAGVIAMSGVSISFAGEQRDTLEKPALGLGNALIEEGIPIVGVFSTPADADKDKDKTAIHVMVGSKPLN